MAAEKAPLKLNFTFQILIGMVAGIIVGLIIKFMPQYPFVNTYIIDGIFDTGGTIFINIMKMMVVPIVFISLVCGTCSLGDGKTLGRMGLKTLMLYLLTTAIAITLGITIANLFDIGSGSDVASTAAQYIPPEAPSLKQTIIDLFPSNPFKSLVEGNMLQVIVFAVLLGVAISFTGRTGQRVAAVFQDLNEVMMTLVIGVIKVAPYGVFCLMAALIAKVGFELILDLMGYFATVLFVLIAHLILTNSTLLILLAKLNPWRFFRKMYSAMLFAFSTSSSNVSIPVTLNTVEHKLGVHNSVAAFVVPLGATINMDGTAIMQGVATVFIAHAYNVPLDMMDYLFVVITATLASIGTAGVPGVGMITLAMVLEQVGLPVKGILLIIGVDRLLDMVRTAVNITGDSAVSCIVGKSENAFEPEIFNDPDAAETSDLPQEAVN